MSTKLNPGKYDCFSKLAADEPYFVLRAKDPVAPRVIEEWVRQRTSRGQDSNPKLKEALDVGVEMMTWRARHMVRATLRLRSWHHTPALLRRPQQAATRRHARPDREGAEAVQSRGQ